ncbi:hypothetical protein HXX76_009500 [Chlamydomonas incerta]|uniref:non-specific serine/threonine protein kinase n=1 Tax=Chlamydomonas incerta TaxID=51695 RepID=A0A835W0A8_CHLIN|nr:hypothetical protein HXX76_009500 [Chlamydomonas incerta]|eukprot:KAG2431486.1 hypothetical protein HXX76_009500 [Chlamydomonas incerta]
MSLFWPGACCLAPVIFLVASLTHHIVKDPVKFPTNISPEFKSFLKGEGGAVAGAVLALATGGVGAERPAAVPATPPARQTETPQMNRGRDPLAPNRRLPALGAQPGGAAPAGAAAGSRAAPAGAAAGSRAAPVTPPANGVPVSRTASATAASGAAAARGPTTPAPPAQERRGFHRRLHRRRAAHAAAGGLGVARRAGAADQLASSLDRLVLAAGGGADPGRLTPEAAAGLWADPSTLPSLLAALRDAAATCAAAAAAASGGAGAAAPAPPLAPLQRGLRLAAQLLQYGEGKPQCGPLQRAVADLASAAAAAGGPGHWPVAAAAVECFRGAEAGLAADKAAASGYTSIALDESWRAYCEVVQQAASARGGSGGGSRGNSAAAGGRRDGSWPAVAAACHALADTLNRGLQVDLYALQLLLQCGRTCPGLCQAAVLAGAPEALLALGLRDSGSGGGGGGSNGAVALLALTAVLEGLHSRRGATAGGAGGGSAAAAKNALAPGAATDDALRRLAAERQLQSVRCMDSLEGEELLLPVKLASRLELSNTAFARQFIAAGGLAPSTMARCLADAAAAIAANGGAATAPPAGGGGAGSPPVPPSAVLVDVLLIVSQLARLHKDSFNTYEPLAKANIYANIRRLLSHPDAAVRSRCCNLDVIRRLSSSPDPTQQKYLQRIQQKLQACSGSGAPPSSAPGGPR